MLLPINLLYLIYLYFIFIYCKNVFVVIEVDIYIS